MSMRGWARDVVMFCCLQLTTACLFDSRMVQQPQSQRTAAARMTPRLESEGERNNKKELHLFKLRIYVAREHAAESQQWRARLTERIAEANKTLETSLAARLDAEEPRAWNPGMSDDLAKPLAELGATDRGDGCDFVVGLVASQPRLAVAFHELGVATPLGKHFILRAVNDARELEAIEKEFSALDPSERQRLYHARQTHKAAANLLHELAHALGAPHVREAKSLLSRHYDPKITGFGSALPLLRVALAYRAKTPPDDGAMANALADELDRTPESWVAEERDDLAKRLRAFAMNRTAGTAAPAAGRGATEPVPNGLRPDDQDRYGRAKRELDRGNFREAWTVGEPLFSAYPDIYEVQDLRCNIAMRLGLEYGAMRKECQRLLELVPATRKW